MRKSCRFSLIAFAVCFSFTTFAQSVKLSGNIRDKTTQQVVPSVSVSVKGSTLGTFTDANGNFNVNVPRLPVTLVISSIGFELQEVTVSDASVALSIDVIPASTLGQEVVVSASRTPERILESPVSIERISSVAIRNAPAASFYDVLANVKGVDITTSSLTFKTPSTRGFTGSGNLRLNQLVDGMDNQAPGLNFSVGGVVGASELDVESLELLPGASSALYGPGGMNGTLLINTKNPFRFQGLSVQIKQGLMHIGDKERDVSAYYNWNLRWAKAIGDKFAFKINVDLISAKDWLAQDYRNYKRAADDGGRIIAGTRQTDPNFDGVNIYGDETSNSFYPVLRGAAVSAPFLAPFIAGLMTGPDSLVSRTGYLEREVVSPYTINYRGSGAVHYKITPSTEASIAAYWGAGSTVYTGSDRYSLRDLSIGQYKLEVNNPKWFLRAYTTQETAGESYNATVTTRLLNEVWKPSGGTTGWYAQYGQAFIGAKLAGATDIDAHNAARATADVGRPAPGSAQFKQIFDQVRLIPIPNGGLFLDKTDMYNFEGQYNFSGLTKGFADVLAGGNFKKYILNSEGTLFADSAAKIPINEVGAYVQVSRQIIERLKITLAGRYDKNENFKGRFTPRATALIKLRNNNNLRLSYQSAYRFPSTQQQWIDLEVSGGVRLIGAVQELKDYYQFSTNPVYNSNSVESGSPKIEPLGDLKPETVSSYEIGYKGLLANQKLLIDVYGYMGSYKDFIYSVRVVQSPGTSQQRFFSIHTNSDEKVKTRGFGFSLDYRLPFGFVVGTNVSSDVLEDIPVNGVASFNAPEYRANLSVGHPAFGPQKRAGFTVVYKWQDEFFYEGSFTNGQVPEIHTVDAQVSYKLPQAKSIIKLGANNLLNEYYRNAAGNPSVGGLYYISFGYNIF